jgi:hypothetical protein
MASMALVTTLVLACPWPARASASASSLVVDLAHRAAAGQPVCKITDSRVTEVSGMVATRTGYVAINDSNIDRAKVKIFFLDGKCRLTRSVSYPTSARDPEDLAIARDGTLWVADIGDNSALSGGSGNRRTTIALWSLGPKASTPVIHRFVYPDGAPAAPALAKPSATSAAQPRANDRPTSSPKRSLPDLTWILFGVGALGLLLVILGVRAARR